MQLKRTYTPMELISNNTGPRRTSNIRELSSRLIPLSWRMNLFSPENCFKKINCINNKQHYITNSDKEETKISLDQLQK